MKNRLLKGLTEDQEKEIRQDFVGSQLLRKKLKEILEENIKTLQDSMLDEEMYEVTNWDKAHIDKIAEIRATKKLISYLE